MKEERGTCSALSINIDPKSQLEYVSVAVVWIDAAGCWWDEIEHRTLMVSGGEGI